MSRCEYCEIECVLYEEIQGRKKPVLGRCNAQRAEDCPAHVSDLECVDLKDIAVKVRGYTQTLMAVDRQTATAIHDALGALICYARSLERLLSVSERERAAATRAERQVA